MTLVLVAHGTREPSGAVTVNAIADALRTRLAHVRVEVAYVDVHGPSVTEVVRAVGGPSVVVPAFLASGYHVRVDVPEQVRRSGRGVVTITDPLGPAQPVVSAVQDRLAAAGWRPGDAVVLAAAGSTDRRALADVRRAADLLSAGTGTEVRVGYVSTGPSVAEAVAAERLRGGRVAVASWLLAPGLFHRRLAESGADLVAEPIGAHPRLVELLAWRYLTARGLMRAA
ncbi:sirohydrochlorin chelatase [Kutzneria viridogrisea]|uniref:Secreted protein n=2 Tax=Kutzneria TaxID=43356 RepID=W5VZN8_9PSEU|nr:sirohydrochlorin chelatase [Kutzneria albida]AHH94388.1 hypothetical protein KALB_1015 [Kutzneria albida DSM 43870]MBA8930054.1 sirohydrochlorin ferrochelatase [Kutzneria viridogrisea]